MTSEHQSPCPPIERVIAERAIQVAYQPIVSATTGAVFAYEALVRPRTPEFDSPASVIAAAVAHGCAGVLGRVIREIALAGCPHHALFLNIHPVELEDRWLVRTDDPVFHHGHDVFLEITEGAPLSQVHTCHAVLSELRGRGLALVVDDFGSGYSNLKYIADLHPRIVKLDRSLITQLMPDTRMFQLVEGVIDVCHQLGTLVVAEGIETIDELETVKLAGVDLLQGYLLARPALRLPDVQMPASVGFCERPTRRVPPRARGRRAPG